MTMLTGKLAPFTGKGKLLEWRVTRNDGSTYAAMMTIQDATHAARSGTTLELKKAEKTNE